MSAAILRHLRRRLNVASPDAELLHRYLDRRDEDAFRALVERHGPAVLGECRRRLRDPHAADDAFQATFLVLARNAKSVRRPEALAAWLYGVVLRICARARAARVRRADAESQAPALRPIADPADSVSARELLDVLDSELDRLPERYRVPLWLVYWQGMTHAEAGRQLGLSAGALHGRLERGRRRLADRLRRRGFAPDGAERALLLAATGAAAVPSELLAHTLAVASTPTSTAVPAALLALATATGPSKLVPAAALAVLLAGAGAIGLLASREHERPEGEAYQSPVAHALAAPDQPPASRVDAFGDPLPPGAIARFGTFRLRHAGPVNCVAFSPDGRILASGGDDRTVRCWNVRTGELLRTLRTQESGVRALAFTPDGKELLAGSAAGGFLIWPTDSDRPPTPLANDLGGVDALALSDDGTILAVGCADGAVRVWDRKAGRELPRLPVRHRQPVNSLAISADGRYLATAYRYLSNANDVCLWTLDGGRERLDLPAGSMSGYTSVAFSPDGSHLIAGGWTQREVEPRTFHPRGIIDVWDPATGQRRKRLDAPESRPHVIAMAAARDHRTLVVRYADKVVTRLDLTSGKSFGDLTGRPIRQSWDERAAVAYAADGRLVASGGGDGTVQIWDAGSGRPVLDFPQAPRSSVRSMSYTADGRLLASGGDDGIVRVWDTATVRLSASIDVAEQIWRLALSPDGRHLATAVRQSTDKAHPVRVFDVISGRDEHRFPNGIGYGYPVAFSPDGQMLAYPRHEFTGDDRRGNFRNSLDLREITTGKLRASLEPQQPATIIRDWAFVDASTTLVIASSHDVSVWDLDPARRRFQFPLDNSSDVALVCPNGRLVATVNGGTAKSVTVWEVASGRLAWELPLPSGPSAGGLNVGLAYSRDGRFLAIARLARGDGESPPPEEQIVPIYDLTNGRAIQSIRLPSEVALTSLAFAPSGQALATALLDSTVVVWGVALPGRPAQRLAPERRSTLWRDLAAADPALALHAIAVLTSAPDDAIELLGRELQAARASDAQQLGQILVDLDSDQFVVRTAARKKLEQLGDENEPAIRRAMERGLSPEARRQLAKWVEESSRHAPGPDHLRRLRSVEVLERIATPEAKQLLERLAGGDPAARLTRQAKAGLDRMRAQAR